MVARRKKSENPKEYLWLFGGRYILGHDLIFTIRKYYKPPPDLYAVAKLIHQLWGQTLLGVGKETNSFGDIWSGYI